MSSELNPLPEQSQVLPQRFAPQFSIRTLLIAIAAIAVLVLPIVYAAKNSAGQGKLESYWMWGLAIAVICPFFLLALHAMAFFPLWLLSLLVDQLRKGLGANKARSPFLAPGAQVPQGHVASPFSPLPADQRTPPSTG